MSEPRQGWRHFRCAAEHDVESEGYTGTYTCGHEWREATRDIHSPSGVDCPVCGDWTFPHDSELDTTLKVDSMGNLIDDQGNLL